MIAGRDFGAQLHKNGTTFRLWAPAAKRVELVLDRRCTMERIPNGWHEITVNGLGAGTLYKYRIDDEIDVPDPASHFQPNDIGGASEVIDHQRFEWQAGDWRGRPWPEASILELHVGTFTPGGTFRSAIERLDDVAEAGFTAIELMPIADFPGRWNWGYDGALIYAPDSSYGRPDDLRALIDAAHRRRLMVLLDAVYNHFGPEGNYLGRYAPSFFAPANTPWGSAIDYRVAEVRAFVSENALHWLSRYRFDGLRLDAVHAIVEPGQPSILHDLSKAVGQLAQASGRHIHLVLENDGNRASLLAPCTDPPRGKYRAQWNDDYHHAWHVFLTGEGKGYYQDYTVGPIRHLARVLSAGFAYQGDVSAHRKGRPRGEPSGSLSPLAFVSFLQNHDQIGNRPLGDRLVTTANEDAISAALAVMLLAPMPPLMFMGEEWGCAQPFPFFCDFREPLASAVRQGRRKEFSAAYAQFGDAIPDPVAEQTFRSAKLDWTSRKTPAGRNRLASVRKLLNTRAREIAPHLDAVRFGCAEAQGVLLSAQWSLGAAGMLKLLANLANTPAQRPVDFRSGRAIWGGEPPAKLPPWAVYWSIGRA